MTRDQVIEHMIEAGIVAVVRASSAKLARAAADALAEGGVIALEITMTVPNGVDVIRELAKTTSGLLIGAGTVLNVASAKQCLDAGAQFLVSPGLDVPTVEFARREGVPMLPGALTPSEVMAAANAGAGLIKIFPCAQLGGPPYIKALRGPFPQMRFVPTGGVNLDNAADYLKAGAAALGAGGELVDRAALEAGKPEIIVNTARRFVSIVRKTRAAMSSTLIGAR